MTGRGKFGSGLIIAFLFLSTLSAAQEKPVEIKLTIKYNDRTVDNSLVIKVSTVIY